MHPIGSSIVRICITGEGPREYTSVELQCYEDFCGGFLWDSDFRYVFDSKAPVSRCLWSLSRAVGNGDSS